MSTSLSRKEVSLLRRTSSDVMAIPETGATLWVVTTAACSSPTVGEQARHAENNDYDIPSLRYINLPTPPSIEISTLLTRRLTHYEALPVIYAKNPFCFSDPSTLDIFHWTHNAVLVREIVTQLISLSGTHFNAWRSYITKKPFNLARDFPNLKRMVLFLDSELLWNDTVRLRPCNIQGLD